MDRNGYRALGGQKSQKRFNVDWPHVGRMLQAVKTDEVIDPRQIGFLGPKAIVKAKNLLASLLQKPGLLGVLPKPAC